VEDTLTGNRLRGLFEAGMALTSELSLDAVLHRLTEAAAELTEARYAALGVIDPAGSGLERFITHGIDAATAAAIGEPPRGRGILGVVVRDAATLRLADLTADPRAVGFPRGHPAMHTFLGVPIAVRGVAYGNLYLAEKADGREFTDEDEELVTLLAAQAGIAIENVRLYEAATRWSRQLESLNEIGNALATETDLAALLELVTRRLRELLDARIVLVLLPEGDDRLRVAAAAGEGESLVGERLERSGSKSGRVLDERRSERVDSLLDDPDVAQPALRPFGARTGLWVPLLVHGRPIGVLAAHDKLSGDDGRFGDGDLRLAETFAARAAVAVDLSGRVARDSLRRVVAGQELERRRLARELHDETGQALTSILLGLRSLEDFVDGDDERAAVAEIRRLAVETLQDVRRLAVELRPKALDDFGLEAALERLTDNFAGQTGLAVDFVAGLGDQQLPREVATALYRIVQEGLTNVAKHAEARTVSVLLTGENGRVALVIEDDGRGFDPEDPAEGFGLQGMRERVALLGGSLRVESRGGVGTTLAVEVGAA
jgi:two-component system, NarL family, sensor histidine kinase DevS